MKRRIDQNWEIVRVPTHEAPPSGLPAGTRLGYEHMDNSVSHIYCNVSVINADSGDAGLTAPPRCAFQESRSSPIIDDASQWDFSVVRFCADGLGTTLPLWIPQISTGDSNPTGNPDLTIYGATIATATGAFTGKCIWTPQIKNTQLAPRPGLVTAQQSLASSYYFANSYTWFCQMVNALFDDLAGAAGVPRGSICLQYIPSNTGFFSLKVPADFLYDFTDPNAVLPPTKFLILNPPLRNLLAGFNWLYGQSYVIPPQGAAGAWVSGLGYAVASLVSYAGRNYSAVETVVGASPLSIIAPDQLDSPWVEAVSGVTVGSTGYTFGVPTYSGGAGVLNSSAIISDYSCTASGLWSPIDGFVFQTNFLPVVPEQGTAPVVVGESNVGLSGTQTQGGFQVILTDFIISGSPEQALTSIIYVPTSEYRISSMTANATVQIIDITLSWRFRLTGQLIPVLMPNNSSISMKLMFRRKDWQKGRSG